MNAKNKSECYQTSAKEMVNGCPSSVSTSSISGQHSSNELVHQETCIRATSAKYYDIASTILGSLGEVEVVFLNAAKNGNYKKLEQLLEQRNEIGLDINCKEKRTGNTALIWAAKRGHSKIVELLLKHEADATLCNYEAQTGLETAFSPVKTLLLDWVETQKELNERLLLQAAWQGNLSVVQKILASKSKVNINCQNAEGLAPLMLISRDLLLLERLSLQLKRHYSPVQVAEELIKAKVDMRVTDNDGRSSLHYASQSRAVCANTLIRALVSGGLDIEMRDKRLFTPIHLACQLGNTNNVMALADGGSDVNVKGFAGLTPLHMTVYNDHQRTAHALLSYGADVTITDERGFTPLDLAKTRKMKILLKEALLEATKGNNPKPEPVSSEERKKRKLIILNKKADVLFDPSLSTSYQTTAIKSKVLSSVERCKPAEKKILQEVEAWRAAHPVLQRESSRLLGTSRSKILPQIGRSSSPEHSLAHSIQRSNSPARASSGLHRSPTRSSSERQMSPGRASSELHRSLEEAHIELRSHGRSVSDIKLVQKLMRPVNANKESPTTSLFLTQNSFHLSEEKGKSSLSTKSTTHLEEDLLTSVESPFELLQCPSVFKEEFLLEESRPRDLPSGSDLISSTSSNSLSSTSPRDQSYLQQSPARSHRHDPSLTTLLEQQASIDFPRSITDSLNTAEGRPLIRQPQQRLRRKSENALSSSLESDTELDMKTEYPLSRSQSLRKSSEKSDGTVKEIFPVCVHKSQSTECIAHCIQKEFPSSSQNTTATQFISQGSLDSPVKNPGQLPETCSAQSSCQQTSTHSRSSLVSSGIDPFYKKWIVEPFSGKAKIASTTNMDNWDSLSSDVDIYQLSADKRVCHLKSVTQPTNFRANQKNDWIVTNTNESATQDTPQSSQAVKVAVKMSTSSSSMSQTVSVSKCQHAKTISPAKTSSVMTKTLASPAKTSSVMTKTLSSPAKTSSVMTKTLASPAKTSSVMTKTLASPAKTSSVCSSNKSSIINTCISPPKKTGIISSSANFPKSFSTIKFTELSDLQSKHSDSTSTCWRLVTTEEFVPPNSVPKQELKEEAILAKVNESSRPKQVPEQKLEESESVRRAVAIEENLMSKGKAGLKVLDSKRNCGENLAAFEPVCPGKLAVRCENTSSEPECHLTDCVNNIMVEMPSKTLLTKDASQTNAVIEKLFQRKDSQNPEIAQSEVKIEELKNNNENKSISSVASKRNYALKPANPIEPLVKIKLLPSTVNAVSSTSTVAPSSNVLPSHEQEEVISTPLIVNPFEEFAQPHMKVFENSDKETAVKIKKSSSGKASVKKKNGLTGKRPNSSTSRQASAVKKQGAKGKDWKADKDCRPRSVKKSGRSHRGKKEETRETDAVSRPDTAVIGWQQTSADTSKVSKGGHFDCSETEVSFDSDKEEKECLLEEEEKKCLPVEETDNKNIQCSPRFMELKDHKNSTTDWNLPVVESDGYLALIDNVFEDYDFNEFVMEQEDDSLANHDIQKDILIGKLTPILETSFLSTARNTSAALNAAAQEGSNMSLLLEDEKLNQVTAGDCTEKTTGRFSPEERMVFNYESTPFDKVVCRTQGLKYFHTHDQVTVSQNEAHAERSDEDESIDDVINEILSTTTSSMTSSLKNMTWNFHHGGAHTLTEGDKNLLLKMTSSKFDSPFYANKSASSPTEPPVEECIVEKLTGGKPSVCTQQRRNQSQSSLTRVLGQSQQIKDQSLSSDISNSKCQQYVSSQYPVASQSTVKDGRSARPVGRSMSVREHKRLRTGKDKMGQTVTEEESKQLARVLNSFRYMELHTGTPCLASSEGSAKGPAKHFKTSLDFGDLASHPSSMQTSLKSKGRFQELKDCTALKNASSNTDVDFEDECLLEHSASSAVTAADEENTKMNLDSVQGSIANSEATVDSLKTRPDHTIQWKKGNVLGRGAFGTVWCGLTNEGQLIAVKQIELTTLDKTKTQHEYEKVQEEVELLKTLDHVNIVSYLGTSLEDSVVSIFMQFVPGGSIANILARFGALEESVFRLYTKQILEGIKYLHANEVIHRDVKGANVMLMPNGIMKLIDFGCAKRLCINLSLSHTEILKSMKGTPYWMAPEVVNETGHGKKSDVWSIGCTVFEMATRKPPWADMNPMAAIFAIGSLSRPIPTLDEKLSHDARDFVSQCLTRDQNLRPSASDLLDHPFIRHRKSERHLSSSSDA